MHRVKLYNSKGILSQTHRASSDDDARTYAALFTSAKGRGKWRAEVSFGSTTKPYAVYVGGKETGPLGRIREALTNDVTTEFLKRYAPEEGDRAWLVRFLLDRITDALEDSKP